MLSEITAVTQLVLVLEVAYLMAHCRAFKNGIPDVLEDFEHRDNRNKTTADQIASILDEIADGMLAETEAIAHPSMDLKSMLTSALLSKFQIQPGHGGPQDEEGTVFEIENPENESEESD